MLRDYKRREDKRRVIREKSEGRRGKREQRREKIREEKRRG